MKTSNIQQWSLIILSLAGLVFIILISVNNRIEQKSLWEEAGEKARYIKREFDKGYRDSTDVDSLNGK